MPLLRPALLTLALLATAATAQTAKPSATPPTPAPGPAAAAAVTLPSGLVYREVQAGSGASPVATDSVKVHYRGTLTDGREFDSSYKRGEPATFPLNRVIPCWTEGVQKMKVGGKAVLTCPPAIGYGERGAGGGLIPPNATLQFEIELLAVNPR